MHHIQKIMKYPHKLVCVTATLLLTMAVVPAQTLDRWPVAKAGKWGYINKTGKVVIPYKFQLARHFIGGLSSVKVGDKWGAIRPDGVFAIPPSYVDISPCIGGKIVVTRLKDWAGKNADVLDIRGKSLKQVLVQDLDPGEGGNIYSDPFIRWGSDFDSSAASLLKSDWDPLSYSKTLRLQDHNSDGVAQWVNGKRGVGPRLNVSYSPHDSVKDRSIENSTIGGSFVHNLYACEEMYPVWSVTPEKSSRKNSYTGFDVMWGFMNLKGTVVAMPAFRWIEPYYGGLAKVGLDNEEGDGSNRNPKGRWGYINKNGKWVWRSWTP